MTDHETPVAILREMVNRFVSEREWEPFHSPKNLAMALSVEAGELMEHFLWIDNDGSRKVRDEAARFEQVADEMADVACLLLSLCNSLGVDLSSAIERKMARNILKYPADKYRGRYRVED
jgi:dCTP diphosphatase